MERGSSKHGPRLDDEMDREVRGELNGSPGGRAEEWHMAEPPGEDQPQSTRLLDADAANRISRFGRYVGLSALPGDRAAIRRSAEALQAPDDILEAIDRLPANETFGTVSEIWGALGRSS